jgi:hypothetical protein
MIVTKNKPGQQKILAAWFSRYCSSCFGLSVITLSTIASIATGSAICHFKPNYKSNNEKAPTQVQEHAKCNTDGIYRDFQYIFFQFFHFHVTGKAK